MEGNDSDIGLGLEQRQSRVNPQSLVLDWLDICYFSTIPFTITIRCEEKKTVMLPPSKAFNIYFYQHKRASFCLNKYDPT